MTGEKAFRHLDVYPLSAARRLAAMLDIDPATLIEGNPLPRGWHFPLLAAQTKREALRDDGFPGLGVPMPDLGLPRLLLIGRTVAFHHEIAIGSAVQRTSAIHRLDRKEDNRGARAVITIGHQVTVAGRADPAIVETQTYMMLPPSRFTPSARMLIDLPDPAKVVRTVTPDSTLLFQYSALGFNSHRIHLDRDYARDVEGFPDLVVNGGLITLLITEMARQDLGLSIHSLQVRHVTPLFAGRPVTLTAEQDAGRLQLRAYDDAGTLAVESTVEAT